MIEHDGQRTTQFPVFATFMLALAPMQIGHTHV